MQVFAQVAAGADRPTFTVLSGVEAQLPPAVGAASEARNSAAETVTGVCLETKLSSPAKTRPEIPSVASTPSNRTMTHLFMGSSFQNRAPV